MRTASHVFETLECGRQTPMPVDCIQGGMDYVEGVNAERANFYLDIASGTR